MTGDAGGGRDKPPVSGLAQGGPGGRRGLTRLARPGIVAAFACMVLAFGVAPGEARAVAPEKRATVLELTLPESVELGVHPDLRVLLTSGGAPVRGQLVSVRLGDRVSQQVTTGRDGTATAKLTRDLPAGTYRATATFAGTPTYQSTSSPTVKFRVRPVRLTIATVPSTPGLPLLRIGDGPVLQTDADGTVTVSMTEVGQVALRLALPKDDATRHIRLDQWDDGSTELVRTIRIPDTLRVAVGLQVQHPVGFAFTGSDGTPIDPAEVTFVRVSDSAGNEESLTGSGPNWLRSSAISRPPTGLASAPIEYRVIEVPLAGVNVVNRGQQRFVVAGPLALPVKLLVFGLEIQGRDALLKSPSGSEVRITAPDGSSRTVELDGTSSATVRLPRGEYSLVLVGGFGIALSTPVALSRDQPADVLLVSLLDIGLFLGVGLGLAIGLVLLGRPHALRRRRPGGWRGGRRWRRGSGSAGGSGSTRNVGSGGARESDDGSGAAEPPEPAPAPVDAHGVPFPRTHTPEV